MTAPLLIVGLGSSHGDDQAGWRVIARLLERGVSAETARAAAHPSQLWDWCGPRQRLTLCDLCMGNGPPGQLQRWVWPRDVLPAATPTGTHDLPLAEVLEFGTAVGCCPDEVEIWTISGADCQPTREPSDAVLSAARRLGDQLWEQLCCA